MLALKSPFLKPLLFIVIVLFSICVSNAAAQTAGPVIERCSPERVAVNSVMELEGYRLGAEDTSKVKVYFTQGNVRLTAHTSGTRYITNDTQGGKQSLDVIVPEDVAHGRWQIFVEIEGERSAPVTVEVADWEPPVLEQISPARVRTGEVVWIFGSNFHVNDEIEITDSLGNARSFSSGASAQSVAFTVPKNFPEGEATVRVGLTGTGSFSQPLKFVVTSGPVALELWADWMHPVAPGQWFDLVVTSMEPLKHSERTEVEFSQNDQHIIVETLNPESLHVRAPEVLSPGPVKLRTRTWREGLSSEWSEARPYKLAEQAAPPLVDVIDVGEERSHVFLSDGPDRPKYFTAHAGDTLVVRGRFPVGTVNELRVTLEGQRGQISLTHEEVEGGFQVVIPKNIRRGEWLLTVTDTNTGIQVKVPTVMRVN